MNRRHAEHSLERLAERLIDAWIGLHDLQRQLDDFKESDRLPEPPDKFESVGALVEYNLQKERYDELLRGYEDRVKNARHTFQMEERNFIPLLPEGVPLIYAYQRYGTSSAGKTYEIVRVTTEGQPSIQIQEAAGES